jgi:hypothetical protein
MEHSLVYIGNNKVVEYGGYHVPLKYIMALHTEYDAYEA